MNLWLHLNYYHDICIMRQDFENFDITKDFHCLQAFMMVSGLPSTS